MIYISELSKTFSGQKVLNNLSLEIQKGEVVALIGSSGAGKSTFLRSLNYWKHQIAVELRLMISRLILNTLPKIKS